MKYWLLLPLLFPALKTVAQGDTAFIAVPPGTYVVGKKGHVLNPLRKVKTQGFLIGTTEVTNRLFRQFVTATGYITDAERLKNAMIFVPGLKEFEWLTDTTASWKFPNGISQGGIEDKMDHPVTTISYSDIINYCNWAKVRLPQLEEWEIAARAGTATDYFWGNNAAGINRYANIWNGPDHLEADSADAYPYTSPVASFAPNAWGLYDVYGNVFEFCEGRLKTDPSNRKVAHARGGSWWCSKNACNFFNSVDIGRVHPHASFSNQGFRVVKK